MRTLLAMLMLTLALASGGCYVVLGDGCGRHGGGGGGWHHGGGGHGGHGGHR